MKRIPESEDEYDAFSVWRHKLAALTRPKVRKKAKRCYSKRFRKAAKVNANDQE